MIWRGHDGAAQPEQRRAGPGDRPAAAPAPRDDVCDLVVVGCGAGRAGRRGVRRVRGPRHDRRSTASRPAARRAPRRGSRTTSASRPGSRAPSWPSGRSIQAEKFGARISVPARGDRRSSATDGHHVGAPRRRRRRVDAARCVIATGVALPQARPCPRLERVRGRRASTTPRPWSRRSCASATRSWSSAAATRPARRRCSCPGRGAGSTWWSASGDLGATCRGTWSTGSSAPRHRGHLAQRGARAGRRRRARGTSWSRTTRPASADGSMPGRCSSSSAPSRTRVARGQVALDDSGFVLTGPTRGVRRGPRADAAAAARDEPAGRVRGRRRAQRLDQAGGLGGGRGLDGRPHGLGSPRLNASSLCERFVEPGAQRVSGAAPVWRAITSPRRITRSVGMPWTPMRRADPRRLVDVDLHELDLPGVSLRECLERRAHHAARSAPRRPQVDEHRQRRLLDDVA